MVSSLFAMAILYGTSCSHWLPCSSGSVSSKGWQERWVQANVTYQRNQEHPGILLWGETLDLWSSHKCSHSRWRYLQFQLAISQAVTRTLNSVVVKDGCSSKNMHESLVHNDMELGLRHCAAQLICYVHNKTYYWAVYHAVYMWRSTYTIVYYTTRRGRLQVSVVVFKCSCVIFLMWRWFLQVVPVETNEKNKPISLLAGCSMVCVALYS